jgi:hypothetical protein
MLFYNYNGILAKDMTVQGLLVEPHPVVFKQGLAKHRNAVHINTCFSPLPRTTFLSFE